MPEQRNTDNNIIESVDDSIPESFPHILFELNADGMFTYINRRALNLTGYTEEDVEKGLHVSRVILPEDRKRALRNIQKTVDGEINTGNEYTLVKKDGTTFRVVSYSEKIQRNGQAPGIRGLLIPLQPGNYYESLIVRERRRSQDILDVTGNIIVSLHPDGKIKTLNRTGYEILGFADDIEKVDWFEAFMPVEKRADARNTFARILSGDIVPRESICKEVVTASGERKIIDWHYSPLKSKEGKVFGVIFSGENITERVWLEKQLRESEEKYRAIFREARDGIVLIDAETGEIVDCNPEYERQTSRTRAQLIGMQAWELAAEGTMECERQRFYTPVSVDERNLRESTIKMPDGTICSIEYTEDRITLGGRRYVQCIGRDVSERKHAEEKLKESEEKFRSLYNTMLHGVVHHDRTGAVVEANPAALNIFGVSLEQLQQPPSTYPTTWLRQDGTEITPDEHPASIARRTGEEIKDEIIGISIKNTDYEQWIITAALPLKNPGDEPPYPVFSIFTDITDSITAESKLKLSEERYRTLFESMTQGVLYHDSDGRIIDANPAAERILNFKLETLKNEPSWKGPQRYFREDGSALPFEELPGIKSIRTGERVADSVFKISGLEPGNDRWITSNAIPQFRPGETVPYQVYATVTDITEQKNAEDALRESESKFSTIFHASPDMMALSDEDGFFVEVNDSFLLQTGFTREEIIGKQDILVNVWANPKDRERVFATYHREGRVIAEEIDFYKKNRETHTVLFTLIPVTIGGKQCMLSSSHDISLRKQALQSLKRSQQLLVKSQELAHVGSWELDFITGDILWSAETYRIYGFSPEKGKVTLGDINNSMPPDDFEKAERTHQHAVENNLDSFSDENRVIRQDNGETRIVFHKCELHRDENGTIVRATGMTHDITEQRRAQEALQESEEKFSKAFHASPNSMAIVTDDGIHLEVNDSFTRITGYTREEIIGKTARDCSCWIDEKDEERIYQLLHETDRVSNVESQFRTKTGEIQTMIISMERIILQGKPCRIVVGMDITERKQVEQALRESEERFSRAFRSSPEAMMITTVEEGRIIEVNDVATDNTGFTREEMIGYTVFELGIIQDSESTVWIHDEMARAGRIHNIERHYWTKTGEQRTMLFSLEEISIGGIPCYVSVQSDITEKKRIEQALEESEEKFSVAFHTNSTMMIITGIENGEYLEVNDSFCKATGYSREEIINHCPDDLDTWVDPAERDNMLQLMTEHGYIHDAEYKFRTKSGAIRTWLCSTDLITIGGRVCALGVAIDITERKEAEAELELMYETESGLREQLEEEMKRRAEFTRALVHELKTPLTPIAASSEVLAMIVNGEPMKSMAENINRGAHNLNKRIDELLELARSELNVLRIDPTPIDLIPLLKNIESEMTSIADKHDQKLVMEIPPTLGIVNADADRIRQVIENLLTNAFKYTPDGGEITVHASMDDSHVTIQIQDNGPGLSVSEAERVFQPYYRKERDRDHLSGLGLGLALCKTLIDLHHGEIWVTTVPDEGSTFSFTLPLASRESYIR